MGILILPGEREILWDRRPYCAEFFGTFFFVTIGVLSIIASAASGLLNDSATRVAVAATHGGAIALMVSMFGRVSGGHFNPAVTFAMLLKREIGVIRFTVYVLMQLGGALFGVFLLQVYLVREIGERSELMGMILEGLKLGTPVATEGLLPLHSLIFIETTLTALLVAVILRNAIEQKFSAWAAGLFIGGAVFVDALAGGPLTGAAMNPARAFGPAAVSGYWTNHWVYWVAPMAGAILGWLINEVTSRKIDR